jgi:hypothetical protein
VLPRQAVSFGQSRPEIAFQAQGQLPADALLRRIDRMSNTMFGLAETFGRGGWPAVCRREPDNPATAARTWWLARMSPELVSGSPMNVFSSAVRKARAIEVSGHVLAEGRKLANDLMIQAEEGPG